MKLTIGESDATAVRKFKASSAMVSKASQVVTLGLRPGLVRLILRTLKVRGKLVVYQPVAGKYAR